MIKRRVLDDETQMPEIFLYFSILSVIREMQSKINLGFYFF